MIYAANLSIMSEGRKDTRPTHSQIISGRQKYTPLQGLTDVCPVSV